MNRDEVEVNKNATRTRSIYVAILTEQAWSIRGLLIIYYMAKKRIIIWPKRELFLVGPMQEILSGQGAQVANQNGGLT